MQPTYRVAVLREAGGARRFSRHMHSLAPGDDQYFVLASGQ